MSDQNTILPDILTDETKIFILSAVKSHSLVLSSMANLSIIKDKFLPKIFINFYKLCLWKKRPLFLSRLLYIGI